MKKQSRPKPNIFKPRILSILDLLDMFAECNIRYFGGSLPTPLLKFIHKKNTIGYCYCECEDNVITSTSIMISDRYKYTDTQLRNVMAHEMIHYFIFYNGIKTTWSHGKEFKTIAKYMNVVYGLNIGKYVDTTDMEMVEKESFFSRLFSKRNA